MGDSLGNGRIRCGGSTRVITDPHPHLRLNGGVNPHRVVRRFEDADAEDLTELLHAACAELGAMGLNYTAVDQDPETTMA